MISRRTLLLWVVVPPLAILLFVLGGLSVSGALYQADTEIPAGFAGTHRTVNGVPVRVFQVGHGPDVLLIHGSPGSLEDWTPVIELLSGSFRLTAFDRPGHGFSGDTGDYTHQHNAEMARGLIDALGLQDVIVAGHSYGGATALALAELAPASVRAYVIVDSAAYTPSREVTPLDRVLALPWLGTGIVSWSGSRAKQRIAHGLTELFGSHPPPPGFVELRSQLWSSPKVAHALAEEILGSRENLVRSSRHYAEIRDPVFIVAQADDEFRRTTAERLHRDVAGSELRLVPGTGHYIQIEKPSEVADAIRQAARAQ